MRLYAFLFLIVSTILFSCSNDDSSGDGSEETSFFALKVGNYWKYQWNRTDSDGVPIGEWAIEEILVEEQTAINNETYFKLKITTTDEDGDCALCQEEPVAYQWVRDSVGYLVDSDNNILFSSVDTLPILTSENTWGDIYLQLQENESSVEVPAGTFNCRNNLVFALDPDGGEYPGQDDRLYAEGIGWVRYTCSGVSSDSQIAEKILLEYQLQD